MNKTPAQQNLIVLPDGRELGYVEYGDSHGIPIFYFHGFPGSRLAGQRFHEVALALGYRIISIDRPGMGLSSLDKNRTLLSWPADVLHLADYLHLDRFSVIGYSGGAPYVAACAYTIPERLKGAVIVSGIAPFDHPALQKSMTLYTRVAHSLIRRISWVSMVLMKITLILFQKHDRFQMIRGMMKRLPEADRAVLEDPYIKNMFINITLEAFKNGVVGPAQEMQLFFKPWGFDLAQVHYPLVIWHGTSDTQVSFLHAEIYANSIPGAQLKLIENEGHHSLINNHIEAILKSAVNKRGEIDDALVF
jgi:pimeloyl-ACP methyl ester carboxylesterase